MDALFVRPYLITNKRLMKIKIIIPCLILCMSSCFSGKTTDKDDHSSSINEIKNIVKAPTQPILRDKRAMPKAIIYKTNGNYDNQVVIGFDKAKNQITYYPAPSDVSSDSAPIELADGWLLERQGGITENSVFLKWTYDEYHSLPETPTLKQLKDAIIPDAKITNLRILDMTSHEAQNDTARVNKIIVEQPSIKIQNP